MDAEYVINYEPLNSMLYDLLQRKNIPLLELSTSGIIQHYNPNEAVSDGINPRFINEEQAQADHVHWDIRKQTALLMDYIYKKGCRRPLLVPSWNIKANRRDFYGLDSEAKVEGFSDALKKYPEMRGEMVVPSVPADSSMHYELRNTYDTLRMHTDKLRQADAIVCHNDIVAQGAIAVLQELGIVPGKDVIITGEGDFPEFRHTIAPVVTCGCDRKKRMAEICRLIARRRAQPSVDYQSVEISSVIIKR